MGWKTKHILVDAYQVGSAEPVPGWATHCGLLDEATEGDWLVHRDGDVRRLSDADFHRCIIPHPTGWSSE